MPHADDEPGGRAHNVIRIRAIGVHTGRTRTEGGTGPREVAGCRACGTLRATLGELNEAVCTGRPPPLTSQTGNGFPRWCGLLRIMEQQHGHPLLWGGHPAAPARCTKCEWRGFIPRAHGVTTAPACTGDATKADALFASLTRVTSAQVGLGHEWTYGAYTATCRKCEVTCIRAPYGSHPGGQKCGIPNKKPTPWTLAKKLGYTNADRAAWALGYTVHSMPGAD